MDKVRLFDVFVREPLLILNYYKLGFSPKHKDTMVFMVDGKIPHGGMFDRLKGSITIYAIAKVLKKNFKIYFDNPFNLKDYLSPNQYDWTIDKVDLLFTFPAARPIRAYGEYQSPQRLFKNRKGETHYYYGYNSLDKINEYFGTSFEWGELYRELFAPKPFLKDLIEKYKADIGKDYIVVHLRFLNLLGDKVETAINPELPLEEKEILMKKCFEQIESLEKKHQMRVMLASDSMKFIEYVRSKNENIYVVPGEVKHIDTAGDTNTDENLKMFLDYYLIAGAQKVYNIVGKGMWKSAFSEYPAMIGNTSFERIFLEKL